MNRMANSTVLQDFVNYFEKIGKIELAEVDLCKTIIVSHE